MTIASVDPVDPTAETRSTVDALYRARYEAEVRRAAMLLGSSSLAHDIVADAFCDVIRRWDGIDNPDAYLSRAVLHGCRRAGKRRRREPPLDPAETSDLAGSVLAEPDELGDAIDRLPWKQRAVVVLKYYERLTEREIATALGIRPGSVGPTVTRALRRLEKEIEG